MKQATIDRIRAEAELGHNISDCRISEVFDGTFTEARINLAIAIEETKDSVRRAIKDAMEGKV